MNNDHELVIAMLALAFAAVMLAAGLLYIDDLSVQLATTVPAQVASSVQAGLGHSVK